MRLRVPNFKLEERLGCSVHLVELREAKREKRGGRGSAWELASEVACERRAIRREDEGGCEDFRRREVGSQS